MHCHFIRCQSNPSRIVYNSLLNMYSACLSSEDDESNNYKVGESSGCDVVRRVFDTMRKRNVIAWNTLISWYVKRGRYEEALKQFVMMMRKCIQPSAVSFVNIFPALSGIGNPTIGNALHGMLLKFGSEYSNDLFVVSSAIYMYSELGCLESARKVFDGCLERNIEIWNTMIGGYIQNYHYVEAVTLFLQLIESGQTDLDKVTFLSLLTAVSQLQQFELAQQVHAYTIKSLDPIPKIIENAIIAMYSRCNHVETSFKVFDKMLERDAVSWNTMVSSFVQQGMDYEGLMLVYEMQKQGFLIDFVTVTALLSAASNLRNLEVGRQTHAYLLRHGITYEGMASYLIDMYAKGGLIKVALQLFEKSRAHDRDQATWNAMIAGLTQNGLIDEAFILFRQMLEQNLMPNAVTLASVLPACNPIGNLNLGKQLHGFSVRHSLDESVFVGTALVDMYSKSGSIPYAEQVFMKAHERNTIMYTTMILGYGQHGMAEKALSLYYSMKQSGFKPDAVTFVAVLSACSYAGMVDEGLGIYESMSKQYDILPSTEHYCCVVDLLGRAGRVVEAYKFVKELGEQGNVLEIWGSLLAACRIHKQFELGKVVAEKMFEMDVGTGASGYHTLLSNIYAEEGKWVHVDRVRKTMREKGMRKEAGRSWIEIAGCARSFVSRDEKHPQWEELSDMLDGLLIDMKGSGYRPSFGADHELVYNLDE